MQFHLTGKVAAVLLLSLIISGCANDGGLSRWGQCALAGGGIAGGLGGVAGAINSTIAGPVSALGGAIAGGIICALSEDDKEPIRMKPRKPQKKGGVVVVVDEPPKQPAITDTLGFVLFAFDSDRITPQYQATLKPIAETVRQNKDLTITLNGYTDSTGSPTYNKDLARRRARSVKLYLRETLKVPRTQIVMGSGGVIQKNNETKEGRAKNRRVDIISKRQAPAAG